MSVVLVVDDEEAILDVAHEALHALGHEVLRAHDGEQALTLARTRPPDLVVSDVMMPRRSGIDLLRAMRSEPALENVPVILMSAVRSPSVVGAAAFLTKPLELDAFESAVRSALSTRLVAATTGTGMAAVASEPANKGGREEILEWVAHELKTPLASVRMNAEIAIRRVGTDGDPSLLRSMEAVVRGTDRMSALINSILDAARLAEGQVVLRRERRDIRAFVAERMTEWGAQIATSRVELGGDGPAVFASIDPELLRQVFDNLVSNAVKYGRGADRLEVSLEQAPGRVHVHVRDYGPGIPASELPRLFDRFHRVDSARGRGHGLGLFIAAAIARLHGGSLGARSALGEGTTFTITLPIAGS